jgi:UDP:flavonoid glycosyltransferase YjiC (YdhE family)
MLYQRCMYPAVKQALSRNAGSFVVLDRYTYAGFDAAALLNMTYAINSPGLLAELDRPPLSLPAPFARWTYQPTTLWDRMANLWLRLSLRLSMMSVARDVEANLRSALPEGGGTWLRGQHHRGRVVIGNTAFGVEIPRPLPPRFKLVGAMLPASREPLNPRLQDWLAEARVPVVYLYLGETPVMSRAQYATLFAALTDARWRCIISIPRAVRSYIPESLPPGVRWTPYAPQLTLLAHPAVRAMVTHCGLTGVQDALVSGKPLLALPVFFDQWEVASRLVMAGAGIAVDSGNMTSADVAVALQSLLSVPRFAVKAAVLGSLLLHAGGADEAVAEVEACVRTGTSHLLTASEVLASTSSLHERLLFKPNVVHFVYAVGFGLLACAISVCWVAVSSLWAGT